ncbi:RNA polymerase sigma-70 factor (ECF subfamily) [Saccharopolyspora lacisalsi]|uniref:RNA polymerase sigma-70 factor (ECF subfamily) n=1 Tax=Halosaccharopolyspora lacisalsi TaxID=1000566 RepID=A0A839E5A4_9PSEU|nr:RNA polymerase sigma-70 factor [Halosaccharopolyspora lacisalsi]MBA8826511.1 RNA polymerase sigma-70 factor (ECF subfamily) [Halosaccharopolyspora lacisalsi]
MADREDEFEDHRERCFAAAYRMLGSVADAEDTVQEVWLRWSAQDRSGVTNPEAYLVRIATRLALNKLRAARARRESYVGPWLPEPLVTEQAVPDAAEHTLLAESARTAMLVVLETLSPLERAVFVLREVFGDSHEEIANSLDRSSASVRQLSRRAREHVRARRPRFETDRTTQQHVTERFLAACRGGDVEALLELLAPDVTLSADGGGKVRSALNPVHGSDKVARFLNGIRRRLFFERELRLVTLNGEPGALLWRGDVPATAMTVSVVDGRIRRVFLVANPDKLTTLSRQYYHDDTEEHDEPWNRVSP